MIRTLVIARAYGGEPIKRVAMGVGPRVVYLANPDRVAAVESGTSAPVGFPEEDVFQFEENIYRRLTAQWAAHPNLMREAWSALEPFLPMGLPFLSYSAINEL